MHQTNIYLLGLYYGLHNVIATYPTELFPVAQILIFCLFAVLLVAFLAIHSLNT
jgi:hypothetical protein